MHLTHNPAMKEKTFQPDLEALRISAAGELLRRAGGPAVLARKLTKQTGYRVTPARVSKWCLIGVPPAWGPVLEVVVPGWTRERLNPWLYTDYSQDIHNPQLGEILNLSTT